MQWTNQSTIPRGGLGVGVPIRHQWLLGDGRRGSRLGGIGLGGDGIGYGVVVVGIDTVVVVVVVGVGVVAVVVAAVVGYDHDEVDY